MERVDSYPFNLENFDPAEDTITSEIVEPELNAADRSVARRASLQILYELDSTRHPIGAVLDAHFHEREDSLVVQRLIRNLVKGIVAQSAALDALLQRFAPEFPINQVATVDRNILRIAVYELLVQQRSTTPAVIISEAVHLAQLFGADNSGSFVHGVLGAIIADEAAALPQASGEVDAS